MPSHPNSILAPPQSSINSYCTNKSPSAKPKKVAIIHYWLVSMRGGEKVLEALCRMFPQAHIFTHVLSKEALSPFLQEREIYTSFIQKLPNAPEQYKKYLAFMPLALKYLDLSDYDLIISSESGPAKGIVKPTKAKHLCYCHTPMRYLWEMYPDYLAAASWPVQLGMRLCFPSLRTYDVKSARNIDHIVANSKTVAKRIKKHWNREASVVYPPICIADYTLQSGPRQDFYLYVGELTDYKRADLAIKACIRLNRKLIIVGKGEARKKYEALAKSNISFLGRVSTAEINRLYGLCKALLFPGKEDFGLVPVEAMATGTPIIAYGAGGATETVVQEKTGVFFHEQDAEALCEAIQKFESIHSNFDAHSIREHALYFDETRFTQNMLLEIERLY